MYWSVVADDTHVERPRLLSEPPVIKSGEAVLPLAPILSGRMTHSWIDTWSTAKPV